eukprot:scaffold7793_cov101-Skeletonema_dohrnii-CCMP3373.AAC.2
MSCNLVLVFHSQSRVVAVAVEIYARRRRPVWMTHDSSLAGADAAAWGPPSAAAVPTCLLPDWEETAAAAAADDDPIDGPLGMVDAVIEG